MENVKNIKKYYLIEFDIVHYIPFDFVKVLVRGKAVSACVLLPETPNC